MTLAITEELGRFEKFFSDVVYPTWPVWLAALVAVLVVAGVVAYRLGWHRSALEHPFLTGLSLALVLAVAAPVGWYTLSPLWERNTVCEASPIAGAGPGSDTCDDIAVAATVPPADTATSPAVSAAPVPSDLPTFEPTVIRQGEWSGADSFHFAMGNALLIETEPGNYVLRVEDFSVRNGPDLFVLLSPSNGYQDSALNLGNLKGTDGAFNYEIPEGADLSLFKSAIVWCRQFDVLFGHAELT
jgi:hypothetical protein